jgi:hypothetical protein
MPKHGVEEITAGFRNVASGGKCGKQRSLVNDLGVVFTF